MTTTTHHPPVRPFTCQPWCTHGDGHPEAWCAEDQYCVTDELYVDLTHPGTIYDNGELVTPGRLHVYAIYSPNECAKQSPAGEPQIVVNVDGGGGGPAMTAAEARVLIENLQLILGQIGEAR